MYKVVVSYGVCIVFDFCVQLLILLC